MFRGFQTEINQFESWPMDELVLRLGEDGVDVPPDANPIDLAAFAKAFYEERSERPRRYTIQDVEYVDAKGVEYVTRPKKHHAAAAHTKKQRFAALEEKQGESKKNDNNHASNLNYQALENPPMLGEQKPGAADTSTLSAHDLGAVAVDEEEEVPLDFQADNEEMDAIRGNYKFLQEEDATEDRIRNEFQRPSLKAAQRYADLNHPRDSKFRKYSIFRTNTGRFCFSRKKRWCVVFFDPFKEGSTSELSKYGVGISLYFKTLKWGFWTFLVMTLVALPQMAINANGVEARRTTNMFFMDMTTLGHLASNFYSANVTNLGNVTITKLLDVGPLSLPYTNCAGQPCKMARSTVGYIYTGTDLIAVLAFLLSLRWLHYFIAVESAKITKHLITAEEYTVQVVRVPVDTTEMHLKKFFSDLTGEPVHDVNLVQDNGGLLDLYVKRGKLINRLWKDAARVHLIKEDRRLKPNQHAQTDDDMLQKQLKHAVGAYDQTYANFLQLNELRTKIKAGDKALSAFVTFESQQGFLKCLDLYPQGFFNKRKQLSELRLDPIKPLRVRQAPPPTTILWENTHVAWSQRRARRWLTMTMTFLFLGISVVTVFFACKERVTLQDSLYSNECALLRGLNVVTRFNITIAGNLTTFAELLTAADRGQPEAMDIVKGDPTLLSCYCSTLGFDEAGIAVVNPSDMCHAYYAAKTPLYFLTFLTTIVISAINIGIQYMLFYFSQFERHHSIVNMEYSIVRRVFIILSINTGLVLLAVNAAFPKARWIGSGKYIDFVPDWYPSVGSQIVVTMIINVFSPHLFPIGSYMLFAFRKYNHFAYSQRELNELYLGPVFFLSFRIAQEMMTIFVTMLYSPGLPALYPICACMFLVHYYVDKYLLFRFYRTPPAYSARLFEYFEASLMYAVIFHLGFATWMYSAPGIFWDGVDRISVLSSIAGSFGFSASSESEEILFVERLSLAWVLPLYIALLIVVISKLLGLCFHGVDRLREIFCVTLTCGIFDDGTIKRRYLNPDFSEAMDSGDLKGLVTYNMLENPYYGRLLGIDSNFARQHKHIASVHEASAVNLPTMPGSFRIVPLSQVENQEGKKKHKSSTTRGGGVDDDSDNPEEPKRRSYKPPPVVDEQQQDQQPVVSDKRRSVQTTFGALQAFANQQNASVVNDDNDVRSTGLHEERRGSRANTGEDIESRVKSKKADRNSIAHAFRADPTLW